MTKSAQERIRDMNAALGPACYVSIIVHEYGWNAYVKGRNVGDNLDNLGAALDAAEQHVFGMTSDALAKTLGIAS